jgi:D-alanyl-D-alanine carboxypeptidase (penicillin-binding protein 5/6)
VTTPHRRAGRAAVILVAAGVVLQVALTGLASAGLTPPPPTPVPPDGSLSPFPRSLDTPEPADAVPVVSAASAVLADLDSGQVLFAKDPAARRPIASVTKIMTALLVLERTEPAQIVTIGSDAVLGTPEGISTLGLQAGERISVENLLYALLLQSANDAAIALADQVSGSEQRFVALMNARAQQLGLRGTEFRSPNGLDDRGFSTARDLATLTRVAYRIPAFEQIATTRFRTVPAPDGGVREIQNRNVLLWLYPGAIGVKTGYTSAAGYCVVGAAEEEGRRLVAVVLGAPGDAFSDAAALLNYGFAAFTEHTFVETGSPAGVVELPGGAVSVQTGAALRALVPVRGLGHVEERIEVDPAAAYPPAAGERVATLTVSIPGLEVGSVPLVVSTVPAPPPPPDGSWWSRALSAVTDAVGAAVGAVAG